MLCGLVLGFVHARGVKYAVDFDGGLASVRLHQLGVDKEDGYSIPSDDEFMGWVSIILGSIMKTDPAIAGIDAIAAKPSVSDLAKKNVRIDGDDETTLCMPAGTP